MSKTAGILSQEEIDNLLVADIPKTSSSSAMDFAKDFEQAVHAPRPPPPKPKSQFAFRLQPRSATYGKVKCPACGLVQEPIIIFSSVRRAGLDCERCGFRRY